MEKKSSQLSCSELSKQIEELRELQDILLIGKYNFQTPKLIAEYNNCKSENTVDLNGIEKGKYYFSETLFDYERTPVDVGPTLFLCKDIKNVKVFDGEGIFGRKKYHVCKQATFTKIWETRKNTRVGYDKNNLLDFSTEINSFFGHEAAKQKEYIRHFDPICNHYYDSIDLLYSANKKAADIFYQNYLTNQKNEFARQAEEYRKLLYVSLKLKSLEEELANKNRNEVVSSINIDEKEFAALQKKYKAK